VPLAAAKVAGSLVVTMVMLLFFGHAGNEARAASAVPRIGGTFLQLLDQHQEWKAEDWSRLFDEFVAMRISKVVVQWSVSEDQAFFASTAFRHGPNPALETILDLADARGMKVSVGLWHDPGYWRSVAGPTQAVEVYLRRSSLRAVSIAEELAPSMEKHPSFDGWYISEEIDDTNWVEPERRRILTEHLHTLTSSLHIPVPKANVSLSCFSNANMDPGALEGFWKSVLTGSSIDRLLFQDGIGAHKLELEYLAPFLSAMKRATAASGRDLAVIVEVFDQTGGPGRDNGIFSAVPAPLARIDRQIMLAAEFATPDIVAFSIPEYMTTAAGEASRKLLEGYVRKYVSAESPRAATQPAALP
jgi:hypothetical protein